MRRLLGTLLGRDYRVRLTRTGREALEAVRRRPPDLVLTDVMMPEMSGTELCKALKSDPQTRGVPVMLVTSKADREMKIEGLELGADDYVTKPFHPRELRARVAGLLKVRTLQNELAGRNAELQSMLIELRTAEVKLVQAERLAAVGELAAGLAHEVNNPVNFALNAARALSRIALELRGVLEPLAKLDPRNHEALADHVEKLLLQLPELDFGEVSHDLAELAGIVTEGLERTGRLVGDLRDFTKSASAEPSPVDVRKSLLSALLLLEPSFEEGTIQVVTRFEGEPLLVLGDPRALNQVFINLIKNAAEALAGTGGQIVVAAREHGSSVVVEVRDDGPGIPKAIATRLFEPFATTKDRGHRRGMGLSISLRVVEAHGGTIELLPRPEGGTIARVSLPAAL